MTKECLYCKKDFTLKRKDQKYCCRRCKEFAHVIRKYGKKISSRSKRYFVEKRTDNLRCEICGFIPINLCQMDIDHIDGNHKNNQPTNKQILCANCHRLKTFMNKDWENKK